MRRLATVLAAIVMGCGSPTAPSAGRWQGLDAARTAEASAMFERVRVCADAAAAEPRGVRVVVHGVEASGPGWSGFFCPTMPGAVGGCLIDRGRQMHVLDWRLAPHFAESFGHEAVHLARLLVGGDADADHGGPWWVGGRACQVRTQEPL